MTDSILLPINLYITGDYYMPIYVRNKRTYKGNGVYIGRPTCLGNPYSHLDKDTLAKYKTQTREEAVEEYRTYICNELRTGNQQVKQMFNTMYAEYQRTGQLNLICWCYPAKCHGEVIRDILLNKAKERNELV